MFRIERKQNDGQFAFGAVLSPKLVFCSIPHTSGCLLTNLKCLTFYSGGRLSLDCCFPDRYSLTLRRFCLSQAQHTVYKQTQPYFKQGCAPIAADKSRHCDEAILACQTHRRFILGDIRCNENLRRTCRKILKRK